MIAPAKQQPVKRPIPYDVVQPHDNACERSVLGSMLMNRTATEYAMEMLTPEYFYLGRHTFLFSHFCAIFRTHKALDETIAVSNIKPADLERIGKDYIGQLIIETPHASNIEGYCSTLIRLHHDRKRLRFALRIVNEIEGTYGRKQPGANTAREPNPTARAGTGAEGVAK